MGGWERNVPFILQRISLFFERYRTRSINRQRDNKYIEEIIDLVRKSINEKGPLSSIDLEFDRKIDWSWSPACAARAALELMHTGGELIIFNRMGTRKVYDFAKKTYPMLY
ncbi:MAG: DNA glycosylase AlkZ-like family protein [Kosmotogaceae bacterium]